MSKLYQNGIVYYEGQLQQKDFAIDDRGVFHLVKKDSAKAGYQEILDCTGIHIFPGFIDAHVHLREPGYAYKETIKTGTLAAAHGGVTTVLAMPNLLPVPDTVEHLQEEKKKIRNGARVRVYPVAAITKGQKGQELADIRELSSGCTFFSDDGFGVQKEALMKEAMLKVKNNRGMILAHCEDESVLPQNWSIQEGSIADDYGLIGNNNASEYQEVLRDIRLSRETGCPLHLCHLSTKESIMALRKAKTEGLPVSAEATPHHLLLCDEDITENDGRFKMNPPLRHKEDQEALLAALLDGTIDIIATDHAPHSAEEKNCPLEQAKNGVTGVELAFPVLYTYLVKEHLFSLESLIQRMSVRPAKLFHLPGGEILNHKPCDLTFFDLEASFTVTEEELLSKGKSTPFLGKTLHGVCLLTIVDGKTIYRRKD